MVLRIDFTSIILFHGSISIETFNLVVAQLVVQFDLLFKNDNGDSWTKNWSFLNGEKYAQYNQ